MAVGEDVPKSLEQFRDAVNDPAHQDRLIAATPWDRLCACMDAIGDTEFAIREYISQHGRPSYLEIYGVLQALFVQQDALNQLCEAVEMEMDEALELRELRRVRNCAVGHPTRQGKTDNAWGIHRLSLRREGFLLYSFGWSEGFKSEEVRLVEVIDKQASWVCEQLAIACNHVNAGQPHSS